MDYYENMAGVVGQRRIGRKIFLGLLGAGAVGVAAGNGLNGVVSTVRSSVLPASGFTIYNVAPIPTFHPATWRLTVGGMVSRKLSFSYDEMLGLPSILQTRNYQCVTGWTVPNCIWQGISLQTLARMAGASPEAKFINFYCSDGLYSESLRLPDQAYKSDVMLAYHLDNKPLAPEQGMPLRLVVPEMYGYKYAKYVNRVEFSDQQVLGYWEQNGYSVDAYLS